MTESAGIAASVSMEDTSSTGRSADRAVSSATTVEGIQALRSVWEALPTHPNAEIDHYLNVVLSSPSVLRPHVTLVVRNGQPVCLAAARIETFPLKFTFGYRVLFSPVLKSLTVIYGGMSGDLSPENCAVLVREFLRLLAAKEVDLITLTSLGVTSPMYEAATSIPGPLCRDRTAVRNTHWRMTVPESLDAFYKSRSKKHRYWLRRIEQTLEKEFPGAVEYVTYQDPSNLDRLFADVETVAKETYQRGLNAGYKDNQTTRRILTAEAEKGRLRAHVLYLNRRPCAFWIGVRTGSVFHTHYTGYDPKCRQYEVGTILFVRMIKELCAEQGVEHIDFGFGDAGYKARFGDEHWEEATVHIFPRTVYGVTLKLLRVATSVGYVLSVGLLKRLRLLEKVKKIWRGKIARQTSSRDGAAPEES
jgi:hypothetical protein